MINMIDMFLRWTGNLRKRADTFEEDMRKIDEKWREIQDSEDLITKGNMFLDNESKWKKIMDTEGKIRCIGNWVNEIKKYEKPDWELFKERILTNPTPRMTGREVREAMGTAYPTYKIADVVMLNNGVKAYIYNIVGNCVWLRNVRTNDPMGMHQKKDIKKFIKEGDMTDLVNIYKVVRKTALPTVFASALISDPNQIIYPMGQLIFNKLGDIGIFGYKEYVDALAFKNWLENRKCHKNQIVIMRAKGEVINADLSEAPVKINTVLITDGIIRGNMNTTLSRDMTFVLCSAITLIDPVSESEIACWTEWEKPELEYAPTYRLLDIIIIDEGEYLLANVDYGKINLVSLEDGNRWSTPVEIENIKKITHKELLSLINQHGTWKWHKKE